MSEYIDLRVRRIHPETRRYWQAKARAGMGVALTVFIAQFEDGAWLARSCGHKSVTPLVEEVCASREEALAAVHQYMDDLAPLAETGFAYLSGDRD